MLHRLRLFVARRRLGKAETTLGVLGWQQADFEGDAQRLIEQLTNVEREQARLTNESARLGITIRQLQDERETARRQFEEARDQLEAEREKITAPVAETERQFTERQRLQESFAERIQALVHELAEANRKNEALRTTDTPEARGEMMRLRGRAMAIPSELADIRLRQLQLNNELRPLEESLARGRAAVATEDDRLRAQQSAFDAADHIRRHAISEREREKHAVEKQIERLEKAKDDPYRKIGQMLADSGIAPMNQPEALVAVEHARAEVARIEGATAASRARSEKEHRAALCYSCLVWVGFVLLAALAFVAARR
ncbi:MAG: hypothetical protein K8R23_20335 [Chthoniobacter sp.]|nr:hypothetical protein [Chthoniobacter sp.]